ncbi:hypothetical protein [Microbacterium sp. CR_7]|uniref:hypothetical protein n=1 Tax=Microbacterium sp. CR_7 TaxID=3055792 RepID=UPI0035C0BC40
MTDTTALAPAPTRTRLLPFAIGVGGGSLGVLPWLVGGARLPLQNLWSSATMPGDMPIVMLPVSQYFATLLFSLVLIGGVFAGVAVHIVGRRREIAVWPAALGVLLVHVIAVVQSFAVVAAGLGLASDRRSIVYLGGMLFGAIAATLMAQLGFWMTSRRSTGIAAFGVALAAVPFGSWAARWVLAFTGDALAPMWVPELLRWVPAVVVGLALAWCGVRPAARLVVWVVSLLALWILPALFGAIQYGLGMRVLKGDLVEMASATAQVFPLMLGVGGMPVLVALVIAVVGVLVRSGVASGRRDDPTVPGR